MITRFYHCIICNTSTIDKCDKCNIVYYCSLSCQLKDWDRHKKICRKTLPEFIEAIAKYHSVFKCASDGCNIQCDFELDAFHHNDNYSQELIKIRSESDPRMCFLCGKDIEKKHSYMKDMFDIIEYITYKDCVDGFTHEDDIKYVVCGACDKKNEKLCYKTKKTEKDCSNYFNSRIIFYYHCLKPFLLPEIIKIILKLCIKFECCFPLYYPNYVMK